MFSLKIVDSDLFLDMPLSSQCLYFHLSMRADDDGFVNNPKKIIKIIGANEDDLKILIAKGFVIVFDQGIIVITHWKINNFIRKDRYKPTMYIEQKQQLYQTENGVYISEEKVGCHLVNQRLSSGYSVAMNLRPSWVKAQVITKSARVSRSLMDAQASLIPDHKSRK